MYAGGFVGPASGRKCTGAVARGRYLGRACILSFRTHAAQIDALVEDLEAAIHEIVPRAVRR